DLDGRIICSARRAYGVTTRDGGWVEQDLDTIEAASVAASRELLGDERVRASDIDWIGLTAQMFDLAPVDAAGRSVLPMLSWLDQRAADEADGIAAAVDRPTQSSLFGSIVTAKDVIPKVVWLRDRAPDAWARTR